MRTIALSAVAVLCLASATILRTASDDEPSAAAAHTKWAFPTYTREDVAKVCLSEYGMANSSIPDCLTQDERIKIALARRWADIDDGPKKECLYLLASRQRTSYFHLDSCIRAAKPDSAIAQ